VDHFESDVTKAGFDQARREDSGRQPPGAARLPDRSRCHWISILTAVFVDVNGFSR